MPSDNTSTQSRRSRKSNRRLLAIASALVGLIAVLLAWWLVPGGGSGITPDAKRIAQAFQRTSSRFPVADLTDQFELAYETLIDFEASRRSETAGVSSDWQGAVRTALECLQAWSSGNPEVYLQWARQCGRELPPGFPIYQVWTMDVYAARYKGVVGHPMPDGISFESYFHDYYTAYFDRLGGALRPRSVAIDPQALIVNTAVMRHWSEVVNVDVDAQPGGLGGNFWLGRIAYSGMMMLWPEEVIPETEDRMWRIGTLNDTKRLLFDPFIRKYGSVLAAEVRIVYESESGVYVPIAIWLRQRPADGIWRIDGLAISNVDSDVGVLSGHAYAPPF